MNPSLMHNIGAILDSANALDANTVTAGGAGDGTEQDGNWVSRIGRLSGKLIVNYTAVLAEGETLTLAANLQDASDSSGTGVADYGDAYAAAVVATGDTGGSTERGTIEIDVDFGSADDYARCQVTPTLSAATTDTVALSASFAIGGASENPITNA